MNKLAREILTNFAGNIEKLLKIGVVTSEHLETTNRNKSSETHSLIWSALCQSTYETVGKKCIVAVEHGLRSAIKGQR